MKNISKTLIQKRKIKGLTQEQLAEMAGVNLRTIQRIESNEGSPRGNTLKMICDALEISVEEFVGDKNKNSTWGNQILDLFFLILFNLLLVSILGFLTIDSEANLNSRIGAFVLSITIPYLIVLKTNTLNGLERFYKFGLSFIAYLILANILTDFDSAVILYLSPTLLISISILYFGNQIVGIKK